MAEFEAQSQKLTLKLVYYGPAQSGKTTNLSCLHEHISSELKGDMMAFETKGDRTLFFDLLPLGLRCPSGLLIKLKLFTVPGQVAHDSTRKAVLSRADGIVFVADSQKNQGVNNLDSFENLAANVSRVGLDFDSLPLVIQFNKRDLPSILSKEEILARWSKMPWPLLFTSALKNQGVRETFETLLDQVFGKIDLEYELTRKHGLTKTLFIQKLTSIDALG
ncbi:MAG: signal recognition particle receptor subunit beta [Oleiphilaceae bacterium]|jgi:signal recognition particle receptor subunit beta